MCCFLIRRICYVRRNYNIYNSCISLYYCFNFWNKEKFYFICSIGIETLQYCISLIIGVTYRITDINDVILNTLGGIIGLLLLRLSIPLLDKFLDLSYLKHNKN